MQNTRKENADEQGSTTSATMVTKEKNDDDDSSVSTTSTDATKEMESLADEGDNDNDDDYDDDDDMTVHLDIIDIGADDTDGDDDDVRDSSRACATADRSKKDDGHSDNENENDVGQKQLTAKQQCRKIRFEQHRDKVLSDIPQHFKDRFGKIFFTMRSRFFRPVLVLNPFSISPGRERYSWCEKYDKAKANDNMEQMPNLCYWYGSYTNPKKAYSFVPSDKLLSYEVGCSMGYNKLPSTIQRNIDDGLTLSASPNALVRGLEEMMVDVNLPPERRGEKMRENFLEVYELPSESESDEKDNDDYEENTPMKPESRPRSVSPPSKGQKEPNFLKMYELSSDTESDVDNGKKLPPATKRRGRPRKVKVNVGVPSGGENDGDGKKQPPAKKHRGRPRKVPAGKTAAQSLEVYGILLDAEGNEYDDDKEPSGDVAASKEPDLLNVYGLSSDTESDVENDKKLSPTTRRRGRPRKVKVTVGVPSEGNDNKEDKEQPPVSKPAGRPRKVPPNKVPAKTPEVYEILSDSESDKDDDKKPSAKVAGAKEGSFLKLIGSPYACARGQDENRKTPPPPPPPPPATKTHRGRPRQVPTSKVAAKTPEVYEILSDSESGKDDDKMPPSKVAALKKPYFSKLNGDNKTLLSAAAKRDPGKPRQVPTSKEAKFYELLSSSIARDKDNNSKEIPSTRCRRRTGNVRPWNQVQSSSSSSLTTATKRRRTNPLHEVLSYSGNVKQPGPSMVQQNSDQQVIKYDNDQNRPTATTTRTTNVVISSRVNQFNADTWWMVDLDYYPYGTKSSYSHRQGATALVARCMKAYNWNERQAKRILKLYRQFLEVKKELDDWDGQILTPSYLVQQMWRCHILDIDNYLHDTILLCGRVVLGYQPDCCDDDENNVQRTEQVEETCHALLEKFGTEFDIEYWMMTKEQFFDQKNI